MRTAAAKQVAVGWCEACSSIVCLREPGEKETRGLWGPGKTLQSWYGIRWYVAVPPGHQPAKAASTLAK